MNIKSKVFKRKTGKSKNKWIVRIEFFDDVKGKKSFMERHAALKSDANDLADRLIDEIKQSHGQSQTGEKMTFNDLANISEKQFYKPAEIIQGRKVSGVRSVSTAITQLNTLTKLSTHTISLPKLL